MGITSTLTDGVRKFVGRFRPLLSCLIRTITHLKWCTPLPFSIVHILPPCLRQKNGKNKRRALIIGISRVLDVRSAASAASASSETDGALKGPHDEALSMGALLHEQYSYAQKDITYLLDRPGYDYPTRDNILAQMEALVKGANAGDRFFIHFSGHSDQEDTTDPNEDDGKNEYIITYLNERIMDDELKAHLVKPLPRGCILTAIFDSCHSGTLLDLPHYRCNRVYLPFENKGVRRTKPLWRNLVRQQAGLPEGSEESSRRVTNPRRRASKSMSRAPLSEAERAFHQTSNGRQVLSINTDFERSRSSTLCEASRWCASPDEDHEYCDGFGCARGVKDEAPGPDVICISSSGDAQETWEDPDGSSVTAELIKIFRENPYPELNKVMSTISFRRHEAFVPLHKQAVEYREQRRLTRLKKNKKPRVYDFNPEMVNFQIPQLSSLKRLHLTQVWDP